MDQTTKIISLIKKHLEAIIEAKKKGDDKTVIKHHTAIDHILHKYVGKKDLTDEEKKKGI